MRYHLVWFWWSSAFLVPWVVLFLTNPRHRRAMWWASLITALFGLTEPLFVPEYWNPPSLFELARRTGFDIESFIFAFAVGGIGMVLYNALTRRELVALPAEHRQHRRHRWHRVLLVAPLVLLAPAYLLPWNPIYPSLLALAVGALGAVICRPDLGRNTLSGGVLFLGLYALFMLGLRWLAPGYIEEVWNLPALSGVLVYGIPLEELLFGLAFGMYWSGVYEHVTWTRALVLHGAET
ncbi:MAG: lycopene cyclase domain-containing protein [Gemmatimonadales bacterium]